MRIKIPNPDKEADLDWSLKVKERDGFQCVVCGSREKLNSHHLVPREIKLHRWDVDNGITLCISHHKFNRQISAHNNPMSFLVWLQEHRPQQYVTMMFRNKDLNKEFA